MMASVDSDLTRNTVPGEYSDSNEISLNAGAIAGAIADETITGDASVYRLDSEYNIPQLKDLYNAESQFNMEADPACKEVIISRKYDSDTSNLDSQFGEEWVLGQERSRSRDCDSEIAKSRSHDDKFFSVYNM
jgi:hypothetical protein